MLDQLKQLLTVTWDGNLVSKEYRDRLVKVGLAQRAHGYNFLTQLGVEYLANLEILRP
jgi:hypothetical protein